MTRHKDEMVLTAISHLKRDGVRGAEAFEQILGAMYDSGFNQAIRIASKMASEAERAKGALKNSHGSLSAISNSLYNSHIKTKPLGRLTIDEQP